MLRLICNIDATRQGLHVKREIEAGTAFDVGLVAEHVGEGKATAFDTIILEILYNDHDYVLFTDPRSHPIVGELAEITKTVDAFDKRPLQPGRESDAGSPFSSGSLLALRSSTGDFYGPYKTSTGRAGISAVGKAFEVSHGRPVTVMAGRMFALAETAGGESTVVISAHVFNGSHPVATESVPSTVTVRPRANRKAFEV